MRRALLLLLLLTSSLLAHSHLFIDFKIHALIDSTGLKGFYINWDFDPMFSAVLVEEYDLDFNGKFSKAEQTSLMKTAFKKTAEADYYAVIKVNGKNIKIPKATKFSARQVKGGEVVSYTFFFPVPVPITKKTVVECYFVDETIFISYDMEKSDVSHKVKSGSYTVLQKLEMEDYLKKAHFTITPKGQ